MSDVAVRVEGLGKQYGIGKRQRYKALRDTLTDALYAPARAVRSAVRGDKRETGATNDKIWALRNVSFEVKRGEVLGVIGRNGAGKSTLLKLLSRITEPSEGTVDIFGRVGSLLEVGTGFNPELTGRENIYLNGAILGMHRAEITRKFDQIVQFAEIEKFLDTPAKHYSTGMYMRLAFSVAAHLEPETLLVDEVLAVGDAAFQRKCLGKMDEVAKQGRTVLFVSHNLQALQSLCTRAIKLHNGRLVSIGLPKDVVADYLLDSAPVTGSRRWDLNDGPGNDEVRVTAVRVSGDGTGVSSVVASSNDIFIELEFVATVDYPALCIGFDLGTPEGTAVLRSYQTDNCEDSAPRIQVGSTNTWRCTIPRGLLNAGIYTVSPRIGVHNMYWIANGDPVVQFEVVIDHGESAFWNSLDSLSRPGVIAPILLWQTSKHDLRVG